MTAIPTLNIVQLVINTIESHFGRIIVIIILSSSLNRSSETLHTLRRLSDASASVNTKHARTSARPMGRAYKNILDNLLILGHFHHQDLNCNPFRTYSARPMGLYTLHILGKFELVGKYRHSL